MCFPKLALGYSKWLWGEKENNLLFKDFQLDHLFYYHMLLSLSGPLVFSESRASLMFSGPDWLSQPSVHPGHSTSLTFLCYVSINILPSSFCLLICLLKALVYHFSPINICVKICKFVLFLWRKSVTYEHLFMMKNAFRLWKYKPIMLKYICLKSTVLECPTYANIHICNL